MNIETMWFIIGLFGGTIILYLIRKSLLLFIFFLFKNFSSHGWWFYNDIDKAKSGKNKFEYDTNLMFFHFDNLSGKDNIININKLRIEFVKHNNIYLKLHSLDWNKFKMVQLSIEELFFSGFIWKALFYIIIYKITPSKLRNLEYINMGNSKFLDKKCKKILDRDRVITSIFNNE